MKKLISAAMLVLMAITVCAQEEEAPSMWVGGEISVGAFSDLDLTLAPSWGMMFNENLGFGAVTAFSVGSNAYELGLEPYIRYYIPVVEQFSFYGDGYLGLGFGDYATNVEEVGNFFDFSVGVRVGMQYWFTPNWSVAASTRIVDFTYSEEDPQFGIGVDFTSIYLALFWHF